MLFDRLIILFNGIPLIDRYDDPFSSVMCDSCDFRILLRHTLGCVNDDHYDICTFYGCHGTDDTVSFNIFFDLIFAAQSCRINKYIFFSIVFNVCIDRISCRTRNIGYDNTLLTEQTVDQGGFSYIRLSYNCDPWSFVLFICCTSLWELCNNLIEQISDPQSGGRRYRNRISNS